RIQTEKPLADVNAAVANSRRGPHPGDVCATARARSARGISPEPTDAELAAVASSSTGSAVLGNWPLVAFSVARPSSRTRPDPVENLHQRADAMENGVRSATAVESASRLALACAHAPIRAVQTNLVGKGRSPTQLASRLSVGESEWFEARLEARRNEQARKL